jgi:ABC-type Mn2+/Zn2+ transport system ATPase subunit
MITLQNLGFSYGDQKVLYDITTQFSPGEIVGIIGPSGAGKTTLLRILLGELHPSRGVITTSNGTDLSVGYVPQLDSGERTFPLTVEEMVLLGAASFSRKVPWFSRSEKREVAAILERLGVLQLKDNRLSELSGGQFQRALIARALMARPSLLLLDEPTSGIDLHTRQQVLDLVHELQSDGFTIILTTHDLNWVAAQLPRILCLNGTITGDGAPAKVLTPAVVHQTYGAQMDVIFHQGRPVVVDSVNQGGVQ